VNAITRSRREASSVEGEALCIQVRSKWNTGRDQTRSFGPTELTVLPNGATVKDLVAVRAGSFEGFSKQAAARPVLVFDRFVAGVSYV
jgi:hypothetical protein